ncbi:tyrosinase family oxidase copper chaperone [Streptomyces sp. NPDC098789]|uniref:tyrosinase family oxidase copper chaperone n=1 Tax=Streptomyces sp. NPDC098789 TaxID=3366098 RepID=UPI0038298625
MHAATGPTAPPTRRAALRTLFTAAVVAATAAALAPVLRARRPVQTVTPAPFAEETYRGRHIAIGRTGIRIDGRPLHVMRRADGSYLSGVNHFESFATPIELARAAVDELGTARLALAAGAPHHG